MQSINRSIRSTKMMPKSYDYLLIGFRKDHNKHYFVFMLGRTGKQLKTLLQLHSQLDALIKGNATLLRKTKAAKYLTARVGTLR